MKQISLFQVYDKVAETVITQAIPSANKLTACLGFINVYIKNKDISKNPVNYKTLELIRVATFDIDENGVWENPTTFEWSIDGKDVVKFVQDEMQRLGVEDFDIEDMNDEEIDQ